MNAEAPARQEIAESRRPARISTARRLYWSVRRELWENQSIYVVPLGVAALIVLGFLISAIRLPETMRAAAALPALHGSSQIRQPYLFAELLLMACTFVVGAFYSLDALQSERRDRSILFWKSLPVSDRTTVLAKASIPLLVLPLVTFAVTVATQLVMLLLESAVLRACGQAVAPLWSQVALPSRSVMLLYHLVTVHGLWYAPIFAWLARVRALGDGAQRQALVQIGGQILEAMNRQVDLAAQQRLFDLFRENAFQPGRRADLGQRHIRDLVARRLNDFDPCGDAARLQFALDPVGLPERKLRAAGADRERFHGYE